MVLFRKSGLSEVSFKLYHSRKLNNFQLNNIEYLRRASLAADFPERSPSEIDHFITEAKRGTRNPNLAIGGDLLQRDQAFARATGIIARLHGQLLAHVTVADNASNRTTGLLGMVERQAKLHLEERELRGKPLIQSRWRWYGFCALSQTAREMLVDTPPGQANLIDIMIGLGNGIANPRQPMSTYPYTNETTWKAGVLGVGLRQTADKERPVAAFGPSAEPVLMERWIAGSLGYVEAMLLEKDGVEEQLLRAKKENEEFYKKS